MESLKVITSEELSDFVKCPLLYEKKYILNEAPDRDITTSHFDGHTHIIREANAAVEKLITFYFHRLMDHRQVHYRTLYKKWEKIWWDEISTEDLINEVIPVNRASRTRLNTALVGHLPKFYKTFHKPFIPLAVGRKLEIADKDILVRSKVQMAYRLSKSKIRIVKFLPFKIASKDPLNDVDLMIQAASWLDKSEDELIEIAYYCMMSPDNYEPFTIRQINKESINRVIKFIGNFRDNKAVTTIDCSGCIYKCNGVK